MKRILLFSLGIACALLTKAQSANFDNTFPGGWIVNPEIRIAPYNSPKTSACGDDIGMVTPPIDRTGTIHLGTSGAASFPSSLTSMTINFDFLAFNASDFPLACATPASLNCQVRVTAYLVPANYTSDKTPTGDNVYGQASIQVSTTNPNSITIPITKTLDANSRYRLFVEGSVANCTNNTPQVYVVDNLSQVGGETQNFNNAFPAGWIFNQDLGLGYYDNPNTEGCADNIGLITPPVARDGSIQIATSPATNYSPTTGTFNVSFDLFAYQWMVNNRFNNISCSGAASSLSCDTKVKIYLVPGNYTSTQTPTGANVLGQSDIRTLKPGSNVVTVPVIGTLDPAKQYRLFIEGIASGCGTANAQVYVVDNIRILEIERSTLPVTFKSFTATRSKSNAVALVWETAMEENNRGFHVQRNIDGAWKNIAFVFSQADGGNSSEILRYSFNDVNPTVGVSQYRLLQVDMDSKGRYSEIRSVKGEGQASKVMVYPNPSQTGNVNILFDDAASVRDVVVTDVAGRVVKQYRSVTSNSLVVENLTNGYYTIQVMNHSSAATTVEKVIIKKR